MKICIKSVEKKFRNHLKLHSNSRIIFSGKFGTGKSYFLNQFFKENHKYNRFHLSPVNYVVGANEDIFQWIKVDLAKHLLSDYLVEGEDEKFTKNLLVQFYLYKKSGGIFGRLLGNLLSMKVNASTGIDNLGFLKKQVEDYKNFKKEIDKEGKCDRNELLSFVTSSITDAGSIFEDDLITQIIRTSVQVVRDETNKENVLIIDDLDRLDPEHIFRILNILSAHNDHFDSNKFGFDKVIVVCDLDNIKNLYEFRYGPKADFEGYIEKFFTYHPFEFTITDSIINYCNNELLIKAIDESSKEVLILLLVFFCRKNVLKVRNLTKIFSNSALKYITEKKVKQYDVVDWGAGGSTVVSSFTPSEGKFEINLERFDFLKVIYLLAIAFGGFEKLKSSLASLKESDDEFAIEHFPHVIRSLALFSHIAKNSNIPQKIFFNWADAYNSSRFLTQQAPLITFLGVSKRPLLKWNEQNRYYGGDFFEGVNMELLSQKQRNDDKNKHCKYKYLISEVQGIVNFVIKEGIL